MSSLADARGYRKRNLTPPARLRGELPSRDSKGAYDHRWRRKAAKASRKLLISDATPRERFDSTVFFGLLKREERQVSNAGSNERTCHHVAQEVHTQEDAGHGDAERAE